MLSTFFSRRRRPRSFHWKPSVDLTNPRIAAILMTFPSN
jgi:hypothetical protein